METQINELLKAARQRAGLSQEFLAQKLFVDRTLITKIETGVVKNPSYSLIKQWIQITNAADLISIDLTGGAEGWKKLQQLESKMKSIRELVNFMKAKGVKTRARS
ncbi:helix-turn-helix domain-containing protein [Paenibacillus chitinolyticus]|uniref:helix-turn-helix domain-containing protein n=1 Tax=Paenibacillus chitinolyticus TaxID=79263 RepID=UPI00365AC585